MKPRHKRIALVIGGLLATGSAAAFVLQALESNITFFISPTQVIAGEGAQDRNFRIGGLVKEGSVERDNLTLSFVVTDRVSDVTVKYSGAILPALFQEGKGVVAQGRIKPDGSFYATEILARHDENYMAPETKRALEMAQQHTTNAAGAPKTTKQY